MTYSKKTYILKSSRNSLDETFLTKVSINKNITLVLGYEYYFKVKEDLLYK